MKAKQAVSLATSRILEIGVNLLEVKALLPHGDFLPWIQTHLPELPIPTAHRWMRAAKGVLGVLPPKDSAIDVEIISVSKILQEPDEKLSEPAKKYKREWNDLTAAKSINECMRLVLVEGEEAHRVDRVINGKFKGGVGKQDNRKDFPLFVGVKLNDISGHLKHYQNMTPGQQAELVGLIGAAIGGDEIRLSRGPRSRTFNFKIWPIELTEAILEAAKKRLKGTHH